MIDLRSDTVTRPTPAMRRVMAEAEVGDDVYGEDPTVRRLEERLAEHMGKEAALFVTSGTMGNQLALRCLTDPGDEILVDEKAHIRLYERGAPAALSGLTVTALPGDAGIFDAATLKGAVRPHAQAAYGLFPPTRLMALENTHNAGGGRIWPIHVLRGVVATARGAGLVCHLDGARLWNASVASGVSEAIIASHFDSVSVCFSKGLGAPVGSVLAGDRELINRARRFRGMFGGAMRQAGIIAAAALYALDHHRERLADDHANARHLAQGLAELNGVAIDPATVETNIVMIDLKTKSAEAVVEACRRDHLHLLAVGADRLRAVTHLDVAGPTIDAALSILKAAIDG